jgi:hypothetical protein
MFKLSAHRALHSLEVDLNARTVPHFCHVAKARSAYLVWAARSGIKQRECTPQWSESMSAHATLIKDRHTVIVPARFSITARQYIARKYPPTLSTDAEAGKAMSAAVKEARAAEPSPTPRRLDVVNTEPITMPVLPKRQKAQWPKPEVRPVDSGNLPETAATIIRHLAHGLKDEAISLFRKLDWVSQGVIIATVLAATEGRYGRSSVDPTVFSAIRAASTRLAESNRVDFALTLYAIRARDACHACE